MRSQPLILFKALLKQARNLTQTGVQIELRQPLTKDWGSHGYSKSGLGYQALVLQDLVPGLTHFPSADVLSGQSLRQVVFENFRHHRAAPAAKQGDLLDEAFRSLRALLEQRYLQQCSTSTTSKEGVRVDVTSKYNRTGSEGGRPNHIFTYRIRITNNGEHPIRVMGRQWTIKNERGDVLVHIPLEDNAVVGQQPMIPAGVSWEYYSGTHLDTPTGVQEGCLRVSLFELPGDVKNTTRNAIVPVGPIRLSTPGAARG